MPLDRTSYRHCQAQRESTAYLVDPQHTQSFLDFELIKCPPHSMPPQIEGCKIPLMPPWMPLLMPTQMPLLMPPHMPHRPRSAARKVRGLTNPREPSVNAVHSCSLASTYNCLFMLTTSTYLISAIFTSNVMPRVSNKRKIVGWFFQHMEEETEEQRTRLADVKIYLLYEVTGG